MHPHLIQAGKIAVAKFKAIEKRNFILGCVGVRRDGAIVAAKNGAVNSSSCEKYRIIPEAHAEARCLKKMDCGGTLFVSRVLKRDGTYAMAKPCVGCQLQIKAHRIKTVYYTIDESSYGIWDVESNEESIIYI